MLEAQVAAASTIRQRHLASRAAIASGIVGLVAFGCLMAGVELRAWRLGARPVVLSLFRVHDIATVLQSVFLIPVVTALQATGGQRKGRGAASMAVASLVLIALLQSLRVLNIGPDTLYMLPQGMLGAWLIVANRRSLRLPGHIRNIGVFAGIGLVVIGLSFVAVLVYLGPAIFGGPVTNPGPQGRMVNRLAHLNLRWSSYVGRGLYPIWAILAGRWLREERPPFLAERVK